MGLRWQHETAEMATNNMEMVKTAAVMSKTVNTVVKD